MGIQRQVWISFAWMETAEGKDLKGHIFKWTLTIGIWQECLIFSICFIVGDAVYPKTYLKNEKHKIEQTHLEGLYTRSIFNVKNKRKCLNFSKKYFPLEKGREVERWSRWRHKGESNNIAPVEILLLVGFHITRVVFFSKPFYVCHHFSKCLKRGLNKSQWFGLES